MYFPGNGTTIIEALLDAGADLNARTTWGDNAVHYCTLGGTLDNLKILLEEGISVTKPKCNPDEAFKIAKKVGFNDVTKWHIGVTFYTLTLIWSLGMG